MVLNIFVFQIVVALRSLLLGLDAATRLIVEEQRHSAVPLEAPRYLAALQAAVTGARCRIHGEVLSEVACRSWPRGVVVTDS